MNMKQIILSATICLAAANVFAQAKIIDKAIIKTTITITAPDDEEEISNAGSGPSGGNVMRFSNMMDGETKLTSYLSGNLGKMEISSEVMNAKFYTNSDTKETVSIMTMMGRTSGTRSTPEDEIEGKKRLDSMMKERAKTDSNFSKREREGKLPKTILVEYVNESKKVSGFNCKKALVITDRVLRRDTQVVWYCPEFKIKNIGGNISNAVPMARAFGDFSGDGFDKVDGTVIMYEKKMARGRMMEYKVTKIEMDKNIAASEFEIPKDVEIKSAKEMMQGGGMRMIMR
jgi:hypothetical protein